MDENELTREVIGAAIEVHRELGPGLLERLYEEALAWEFGRRGLGFVRQGSIPLRYKGHVIGEGLRPDFLVQDKVVVEIKAIEQLLPVHEAQLLSYLRLLQRKVGLLINFNVPVLVRGVKRMVNEF